MVELVALLPCSNEVLGLNPGQFAGSVCLYVGLYGLVTCIGLT